MKEFFAKALAKRDSTSVRLFDEERISGLIIEKYGTTGIFVVLDGRCLLDDSQLKEAAAWYGENAKMESIYLKHFVADRTKESASGQMYEPTPFWGTPAPETVWHKEGEIVLGVRPYSGFSVGVFSDQRNNRAFLASLKVQSVLNLFAYSCAFSVACAKHGAKTTSVDLSKKYLGWGRENFLKNEIPMEGQRIIAEDALKFLEREERRGNKYELVIVDPPSFSRDDKGKPFSVARDIERLVRAAEKVVAPKGYLFLSTNYSEFSQAHWVAETKMALTRKAEYVDLPGLPDDYRHGAHHLSCVLYRL